MIVVNTLFIKPFVAISLKEGAISLLSIRMSINQLCPRYVDNCPGWTLPVYSPSISGHGAATIGSIQSALCRDHAIHCRISLSRLAKYESQEQLETFLAQIEAQTGSSLPAFVKDEFDAFRMRILAHGFLRLRCAGCAHEKLVTFSCKRRGFFPRVRRPAHGETAIKTAKAYWRDYEQSTRTSGRSR